MAKKVLLKVEEQTEQTTALVIGDEYPLIAGILRKKLSEEGCQVYRQATALFDYIIVLGHVEHTEKIPEFLKNQGKVLLVTAEPQPDLKPGQTDFAVFSLSATQTLSSKEIAEKILRRLFRAKRITVTPKVTKTKRGPVKKTPVKIPFPKKILKIVLVLLLLASPFIFLLLNLFAGFYFLNRVGNLTEPVDKRQQFLKIATISFKINTQSLTLLSPAIAILSPEKTYLMEQVNILGNSLTSLASQGLTLEKVLKDKAGGLFTPGGSNALAENLPFLQNSLSEINLSLDKVQLSLKNLESFSRQWPLKQYWPKVSRFSNLRQQAKKGAQLFDIFPELAAFSGSKRYLVLLQNNFELRATGGFIGSYGILTVTNGALESFKIEDVYTADGQLKGHVEPPAALARYLNQPNWFLRDSNWDPDFAVAARQAEWFLNKELGENFDGVLGINLNFIENLLNALNGVYVPDYQATVQADDFFLKLEADREQEFFPGSGKKRNLLNSLTSALFLTLSDRKDTLPYFAVFEAVSRSLEEKDILFYSNSQTLQKTINNLGWAGRIASPACTSACLNDYLFVIDSNLGVNKVNVNIKKELTSTIIVQEKQLKRNLSIFYQNLSQESETPNQFHGLYKNYLRVILPKEAQVESLRVEDKLLDLAKEVEIGAYQNRLEVGFLVEVPAATQLTVSLMYFLPLGDQNRFVYQLLVQKQPGTRNDPFILKVEPGSGWKIEKSNFGPLPVLQPLNVDKLFQIDFERSLK